MFKFHALDKTCYITREKENKKSHFYELKLHSQYCDKILISDQTDKTRVFLI